MMADYVIVLAVLLSLRLKVCASASASSTSESVAHAQAPHVMPTMDTATYFRRDPFGANTYAFGYEVNDKRTGNVQFRDERRFSNGTVDGSYGYVRTDGRVLLTRYRADGQHGYQAYTETLEAGEQTHWQPHWPAPPTSEPSPQGTNATLKDETVQHSNETTTPPIDLAAELLNPTVLDLINGKVPAQNATETKDGSGGNYQIVHDFLPSDFPIAPFELPRRLDDDRTTTQTPITTEGTSTPEGGASAATDTKEAPNAAIDVASTETAWYQKIIDQSRSDFLANEPGKLNAE